MPRPTANRSGRKSRTRTESSGAVPRQLRFSASLVAASIFFLMTTMDSALGNILDDGEDGDAALSSEFPHIPEPMVFDLVRPLGVQRGEFEMNVLAGHSLKNGETEWAPELEYAVRDGFAIEFELPFENLSIAQYKLAVQGTLGTLLGQRYIHGWQVIGRYDREHRDYSADALYLAGYRWNAVSSTFNMAGVRWSGIDRRDKFAGIVNTSWFYNVSDHLTFGIELDNEIDSRWRYFLIPQIHLDLTDHATLQLGVGPSRMQGKHTEWQAVWRMIFAF
ncbi:conserved protein of unknown function [Methylocaldum szegediense]|uniref:MetA-pathway of phenol degradation n=2 Tax=Methylocaldum szegediense TaxID=73780 RepID=A0ABN8X6R0_9GAMM|nr:conserved protein of unknown function [Methylocaldum szegediense]